MASVNKVILIGNLGKDPEMRYFPGGDAIANFSIATTHTWKDKTSGEKQEKTDWHRISVTGRQAEIAGEYLKKGSPVYIEGRLQTRKWQNKEGQDQYVTEIIAYEMKMLGGRSGGGNAFEVMDKPSDAPSGGASRDSGSGGGSSAKPAAKKGGGGDFDDFEDDIPF